MGRGVAGSGAYAPRVGELFCGAGGFALGALAAGCRYVWGVDNDADACGTMRANLDCEVLGSDVEDVDWSSTLPVDGLLFGFPCNDWSQLGAKEGLDGRHGALFFQAAKALDELRPRFFVAENVKGILADRAGFNRILETFSRLGYRCRHGLVKMEEHGLPQIRHRIFMLGVHDSARIDAAMLRFPEPNGKRVSAKAAIEDIPREAGNQDRQRQSETVTERLRHIPPGGNAYSAAVPPKLRLNHESNLRMSRTYRRLDPNRPAYTLTAGQGGGQQGFHWSEPRALTNRERARLQSFPDDHIFVGSHASVRRQIGMAVPPLVAGLVIRELVDIVGRERKVYRSGAKN